MNYSEEIELQAKPEAVFEYVDDHQRFSSHMGKSSLLMGGGKMAVSFDKDQGRKEGSHIKLSGTAFGIPIAFNEVVTRREPPRIKQWNTVGDPKLLVVGHYEMTVEIVPKVNGSLLKVSIRYELPERKAWLGKLFGGPYAKWCVRKMLKDSEGQFRGR